MGDRLCGAEAADAGGWIEAALEVWDVLVEAEGAARRLVGHADTKGRGISGPPTLGGRSPHFGGVGQIEERTPSMTWTDTLC